MEEYSRTVLMVGYQSRFEQLMLKIDPRFPHGRREWFYNGVRYVQICNIQEARGYDVDTTTYKYIGPHHHQFENVLLECRYHYEEADESI